MTREQDKKIVVSILKRSVPFFHVAGQLAILGLILLYICPVYGETDPTIKDAEAILARGHIYATVLGWIAIVCLLITAIYRKWRLIGCALKAVWQELRRLMA